VSALELYPCAGIIPQVSVVRGEQEALEQKDPDQVE